MLARQGASLLSAFYLNELLLKLTTRDDPNENLFAAYDEAITSLRSISRGIVSPATAGAEPDGPRPSPGRHEQVEPVLRRFELRMLRELGYALELSRETLTHAPIVAEKEYLYVVERGPVEAPEGGATPASAVRLRGQTLIDLERGRLDDAATVAQAKSLMRLLINHSLNGQELATRAMVRDLQRLEDPGVS